jgi:hypothetical protein
MQPPKKYKENFNVSCEGPYSGVSSPDEGHSLLTGDQGPSLKTSKFSLYFSGSCIPINESLLLLALPTPAQKVENYITVNYTC